MPFYWSSDEENILCIFTLSVATRSRILLHNALQYSSVIESLYRAYAPCFDGILCIFFYDLTWDPNSS